ncbi:WD40 repeat-like protein [Thelephora ganbajun]|uniref:WD40 repeat-like protein n=1 Tax=Thelephora ganbajun TaxID=370292 RepID=A0ACB6Z637_THEGA|nr:WD40 repeat-like protein [Thelephora ganbajun]
MVADPEDITSAGEDSPTRDDNAPKTNKDDPQVPQPQPPTNEYLNRPPPPPSSSTFSPDGTLLTSRPGDKLVKIWSPHTGKLVRSLTGHPKGLSAVVWSSDSVFLALASGDTTIRIWTVDTGLTTKILKSHTRYMFCVNYNSASDKLVVATVTWIWDITKGKCLKTLHGHLAYVAAVHSNWDASLIVSCICDGSIRIWNSATGQYLKTLAESYNAVCQHAQFSPNSKYILSRPRDPITGLPNLSLPQRSIFSSFTTSVMNYVDGKLFHKHP